MTARRRWLGRGAVGRWALSIAASGVPTLVSRRRPIGVETLAALDAALMIGLRGVTLGA